MNYPLSLTFRIFAIANQIAVRDAGGSFVFYVKQKAFKLREQVTVFADEERTSPVAHIKADRILDISATYGFEDAHGRRFGAVKRSGMKSLWRAQYEVMREDDVLFVIREDNAFVKFADALLYRIPVVGLVSGYIFHPAYTVSRPDGTRVLHLRKTAAFFEGKFTIDRLADIAPEEETLALLSILMMVLLERTRG